MGSTVEEAKCRAETVGQDHAHGHAGYAHHRQPDMLQHESTTTSKTSKLDFIPICIDIVINFLDAFLNLKKDSWKDNQSQLKNQTFPVTSAPAGTGFCAEIQVMFGTACIFGV